ncbi:MAG: NfeD family protein [Clostridiales bacterium]|nr:NfeD family protein [Clostridiales bacterium]
MNIFGFILDSTLIWISIAVIFAIIEAVTLGLTTIWFTIGSIVAALVSYAGGSITAQVVAFLIVSLILLYFTKPIAEKKLKIGHTKTNVNALIGQIAVVTEDILPHSTGLVKVGSQVWTAISDKRDQTLKEGTEVKILKVGGG